MTHFNSKAMSTNDIEYGYYINNVRTCLANHMGFISCHITPLVIYSLGEGHTYIPTQTHIPKFHKKSILRNTEGGNQRKACP